MVIIANLIIVLFGLFIVFSGFLMFFKPERLEGLLQKQEVLSLLTMLN
jgi:uncharacterized membrane protein